MRKKIQKELRVVEDSIVKKDNFDPFGSYSGVPADPDEKPVQDADDL